MLLFFWTLEIFPSWRICLTTMQELKSLGHKLLTESVLKTLAQNRITTLLDFLQEDTGKLVVKSGLPISEFLSLRSYIFSKFSASLINGTTLLQKSLMKKKKFFETGLQSLDVIINGGIPLGYITEIFGLADSGKTQLCLQLAINCVKNTDSTVLYIDTKGDFSAIRVQKLLDAQGLSHKEMAVIMHKIKVIHIWTMEEIIELLKKIKNKILNITDLSLIIIDSLPCLMFQYLGDNNKIGLSFLNKFVNYCRFLCRNMNVSILCINIQTRWIDNDVAELDDEQEQTLNTGKDMICIEKHNRCLGNYWRHIPAMLLLLEKLSNNTSNIINVRVTNMSSINNQNKCILKLDTSGLSCVNVVNK